ncbi:MAG TPA: tetratricopeptide repeat protein [Candidatus Acidoferrales bacterium]|nr:tetratricopeptide repeat protein [Candidatus Acidoferrales bacterium]
MKRTRRTAAIYLAATFAAATASGQSSTGTRTKVHYVSPEDVALHQLLVDAKAAADKNDYATATEDYEKYLEQKPNDAEAHFDLGYVYTAQHQNEMADTEYRKAIELDPKMTQAYLNLGISLIESDPKAAIDPLQKVTEQDYGFERGHFLLGMAEENAKEFPEAVKELGIAVKLDPNDEAAYTALGRAELASGNAPMGETNFREALKLKASDPDAQLGLANCLIQEKKPADAAAALADYLKAQPNDERARMVRASILADMGENDEAVAELDTAAKARPETPESLKLRALIYYREKKFAQTVAVLQKAEAMDPQNVDIHAEMGHALLEMHDYGAATKELETAFQLDTNANDVLHDLMTAEYLNKNYTATLTALDILARRETPNAGAWFVRATCYDHLGQLELALDAYKKFLALNKEQGSDEYFEAAARVRFLEDALKNKRK